ncbi:glucosamine-6-phosphate deaminase [Cytobacillus sp. IB215665]|uniref:glucosamine-6-phosphate deaminase n=1 Tax=Cytobacillus sp. IB215665 TaxID=3097357 RepID=UPI002A130E5D|nr:glucosamine-6-phosphate deaminase [Cytobacillus sp. IB215665]MDX8365974.1 glucosamine-6-phosphate deaminase [Cytobacillus sp. IB215665]
MNIIEAKDYQDLSIKAAQYIIKNVRHNPNLVLGLATGSTPKGTYEQMIKDFQQNNTSYQYVKTINLDEYVGLAKDDLNSYSTFMNEHLFNHIDIPHSQTYIPNGMAKDLHNECAQYDRLIHSLGGVDLQLLGIGHNGHIGFNEPNTSFKTRTHIVKLASSTRNANERFFQDINEVPNYAITMGIQTILESKEILLLVSGKGKAKAVQKLLVEKNRCEQFPASSLYAHPHVTIIADKAALSLTFERKES